MTTDGKMAEFAAELRRAGVAQYKGPAPGDGEPVEMVFFTPEHVPLNVAGSDGDFDPDDPQGMGSRVDAAVADAVNRALETAGFGG